MRSCKKRATEQAKLIADQQKLIADQQKQTMDYAARFDENDKKNEETSRKFSTLLQVRVDWWTVLLFILTYDPHKSVSVCCFQELNKCKTDLQYWRSTSSSLVCSACGQVMVASSISGHLLHSQAATDSSVPPFCNENGQESSPLPTLAARWSQSAATGPGCVLKRKLHEGVLDWGNSSSSNSASNIPTGPDQASTSTTTTTPTSTKKARRGQKSGVLTANKPN